MIGKPPREAQAIYTQYDRKLPFPRDFADAAQREAVRHGYTLLYDGARRHWDRWAPQAKSKGRRPLLARRGATTHPLIENIPGFSAGYDGSASAPR